MVDLYWLLRCPYVRSFFGSIHMYNIQTLLTRTIHIFMISLVNIYFCRCGTQFGKSTRCWPCGLLDRIVRKRPTLVEYDLVWMYKVLTVSLLAVIQLPMFMINDNLDSIYMCIVSLRGKKEINPMYTINIFSIPPLFQIIKWQIPFQERR